MSRRERFASLSLGVVLVGVTLGALARYPGSAGPFLVFSLCFFALLAACLPRPRLYGYTFLAAFMTLGFWLKVVVQSIWPADFLEPIGDFANTSDEWDRALTTMSCAALAVVLTRCAHLWWARRSGAQAPALGEAPAWFARWRVPLWNTSLALVLAVNAANLHFAFYQIGVNTKWLLPFRMHTALAWLVNCGFALWIATLAWWEFRREPQHLANALFAALGEAFLSSIAAFSRSVYLVHAAPYWLAVFETWAQMKHVLERRRVILLVAGFLLLFVFSVAIVFLLRASTYPLHDRSVGGMMGRELPQLIVRRWVGLEGVLAAGSSADRGSELLQDALRDSPKLGGASLYQRIAKMQHPADDTSQFTFLTNAGPVAILLLSASNWVVALGMAAIALVMILTEMAAGRWLGNPFLLGVAGAAMANVVVQTTFFYLTAAFFLELWVSLAVIAALQNLSSQRDRNNRR